MTEEMKERVQAVRAMELLARSVNCEDYIEPWIVLGVADGDITEETTDEEIAEDYCEDNECFSELMNLFLGIMKKAKSNGGLYIGGVCSE